MKSRPAIVGEKLVTKHTNMTTGLFSPGDYSTAVCILPGSELAFDAVPKLRFGNIKETLKALFGAGSKTSKIATFCQINKDNPTTHHDAFKFEDGSVVLTNDLDDGIEVTVLQLPAASKMVDKAQERVPVVA